MVERQSKCRPKAGEEALNLMLMVVFGVFIWVRVVFFVSYAHIISSHFLSVFFLLLLLFLIITIIIISCSARTGDVVKKLVDNIPSTITPGPNSPLIASMSVMERPPHFVNLSLSRRCLAYGILDTLRRGPLPPVQRRRRCVVDFSSPNIAKEMHVGHLRSTIIGECICRVLEFCGHEVMRVNHVGDWGTQFGMLISHLMDTYPNFVKEKPSLSDLNTFYKEAKKRFDNEPEFRKRSQLKVVTLQSGDEETLQGWRCLCDLSRAMFREVYGRLDCITHEMGESFYNPLIGKVIKELDGKVCVPPSLSFFFFFFFFFSHLASALSLFIMYVTHIIIDVFFSSNL